METIEKWLEKIPAVLSCKTSIFIYLFLFFYLVIFPALCAVIPWLAHMMPTDMIQLILGNYTNVLSALGASIAAGTGIAVHNGIKRMHKRHDDFEHTINQIHQRINQMAESRANKKDA